jgi:hypothetical protein
MAEHDRHAATSGPNRQLENTGGLVVDQGMPGQPLDLDLIPELLIDYLDGHVDRPWRG